MVSTGHSHREIGAYLSQQPSILTSEARLSSDDRRTRPGRRTRETRARVAAQCSHKGRKREHNADSDTATSFDRPRRLTIHDRRAAAQHGRSRRQCIGHTAHSGQQSGTVEIGYLHTPRDRRRKRVCLDAGPCRVGSDVSTAEYQTGPIRCAGARHLECGGTRRGHG